MTGHRLEITINISRSNIKTYPSPYLFLLIPYSFYYPFYQKKLDGGTFSRMVYSNNFLRSLKAKARVQHAMHPTAFDIDAINRCTTIGDFDEAYIAPIYGFKDKMDYYVQSSSKQYLRYI